jgi:hypothetical protein
MISFLRGNIGLTVWLGIFLVAVVVSSIAGWVHQAMASWAVVNSTCISAGRALR